MGGKSEPLQRSPGMVFAHCLVPQAQRDPTR